MKIWLCVVSVLLSAQLAWAQAPAEAPGLPQDDPAYADLAIIYDSALIGCCYGCNGKFVPLRHYEFAVSIARLIQNIPLTGASGTRSTERDLRVYAALARLMQQFAPDLRELGISSSDIDKAYAALTEGQRSNALIYPFNDVSPGHWAIMPWKICA
jgi:hypothetical protein